MRVYVKKDARFPLPKPIVFKIDFIKVDGDYAGFQGFPVFEDGSDVIGKYLPDIVYSTILIRSGNGWRVITDLSRSDVPSDEELRGIAGSLPVDLPRSVLPEWLREALRHQQ